MKFLHKPFSLLLLLLILVLPSFAQSAQDEKTQNDKSKNQKQEDAIRLAATLVQVPVIVSEPGGRYVLDLAKKDFQIFEDGVRQDIEFFGSVDEPFSVALLIDSSGSTMEQLDKIKESATAFINKLKPNDQVMVVSFNDSVQVLCEMTSDRNILARAIRSIRPGEYTQVYEAVYTAVWEKLNDLNGRKAVILFSDGIDTASSEIILEDTLDAVIESEDVIIYPIRYNTRPDIERRLLDNIAKLPPAKATEERQKLDQLYRDADDYLYKLAEMSGGIVEKADDLRDLDQAFAKIAEELRHQFLLGYYPSRSVGDNSERKIRVTVARKGLRVRARPSYSSN